MRRGFLAAREDLVKSLSELVVDRHQKLYGVVNEILEQALRVYRFGKDLAEVVDEYEVFMAGRGSGYMLIAQGLLYPILERAYLERGEKLVKAWFENGVWLGNYLSAKFGEGGFKKLERVLRALLWEASEFRLTEGDGGVSLRYISPASPLSYTTLLAPFLEGVMSVYGQVTVKKEVSRGVVIIDFSQRIGSNTRDFGGGLKGG
ncbi:MAG: hypothetical protein AOA65_1475 [Candidatus Bathyarchaeota archaeon BA1]|nr:MAG: hypothetical protein AOA65_1475 [Candidatus Bathyarchaeota archaeon BA1]